MARPKELARTAFYDTDELQNSALLRGLFYNEVGLRSSSVRSSG